MDLRQMDGIEDYEKIPLSELVNESNADRYDSVVDDLLEKMLTYDHTQRITAGDAMMHAYFDEVREGINAKVVKDEEYSDSLDSSDELAEFSEMPDEVIRALALFE